MVRPGAALVLLLGGFASTPFAAAGELEIGVYGGANESVGSRGVLDSGTASEAYAIDWQGRSFSAPIYYGLRLTYWPDWMENWGIGLDFTHAKAYADLSDPALAADFSVLEFTDGLNLLTLNGYRKWDLDDRLRAYLGAGVGVNIPHVEITTGAGTVVGETSTFEYQLAGPAAQILAGVSYEVLPNLRLFGEYKLSYARVNADLAGSGGSFSTDIASHHILAGLSYAFDGP